MACSFPAGSDRPSLAAITGAPLRENLALEQTAAPEGAELWSRLLLTSVRYAAKIILSNVAEKLRQERRSYGGLDPHYARVNAEHESNPARWLDRLRGYMRVFETEITDGEHTAYGRGPTPEVSQKSAQRIWMPNLGSNPHPTDADPR